MMYLAIFLLGALVPPALAQDCAPLPLLPSSFKSHLQYNSKTDIRFKQKFSRCALSGSCAPYPAKAPPITPLGESHSIREVMDDVTKRAAITSLSEFKLNNVSTLLQDKIIWNDGLSGAKNFLNIISIGWPHGVQFCLTDNVYQSSILDWLFGFDPNCQTNHTECQVPSITNMLHLAGCWTEVGKAVYRGVNVIEYNTTWTIEAWKANLRVKYYWSDPELWMSSSGMGRSVPIAALIDGEAQDDQGSFVNIVEEIDYQEFFEVVPDHWNFYPPADMYCEGRALNDNLPKDIPDFFSFGSEYLYHHELAHPEGGDAPLQIKVVMTKKEWYDYTFNLSRVDYKPFDWSNPKDPFAGRESMVMDIQDFNSGLSYLIDKEIGNCTIKPLSEDYGAGDIYIDENGHLHMQDPLHFFHMDQKFAYNGVFTLDRGIPMDAFVTTQQIIEKPGMPEKNYTTAIFLTSSSIINQDSGTGERLIPAKIVRYPQDQYNDKRFWVIYNIYHFSRTVPDFQDFDISPCFEENHKKRLSISMTWGPEMDIKGTIRLFNKMALATIATQGKVAPIRIQHIETIVFESKGYYDLIFTVLDYPPINLDEIGLPPSSLISLKEVMDNLVDAVNHGRFKFEVFINSENPSPVFTIAIPGSLIEVDSWSGGGLGGIGDKGTHVDYTYGYTSGAMAGLAFGMILLGTLVAGTVYFFVFRNNVRAGLPVLRGFDNPLQGLTGLGK